MNLDFRTSYSQNFEDIFIWFAWDNLESSLPHPAEHYRNFIDVGVWDPVTYNVSLGFIQAGWGGILVEPNPNYAALIADSFATNPKIEVVEKAVSSFSGWTFLEIPHEGDGLANVKHKANPDSLNIKVRVATLDEIIDKHKEKLYFYLKLDVEGHEYEVLKYFKWQVRPVLVVIEGMGQDVVTLIKSRNYRELFFDGLNSYFIDNELEFGQHLKIPPLNIVDYPRYFLNHSKSYSGLLMCPNCSFKEPNSQKKRSMFFKRFARKSN